MAETIIIQQENLFLTVVNKRITALPDAGLIASMERLQPRSAVLGGLHQSAVFTINASSLYRFTINVLPMSIDDAWLFSVAAGIQRTGKLAGVALTYNGVNYVSGSASVETEPTRNFTADGAEVMSWPLVGLFQVATVGAFTSPGSLAASDLE